MSEDDPEDPFEDFDVPEDPEDPFEDLDVPEAPSASDEVPPPDAENPMADVTLDAESGDGDATPEDPFSDMGDRDGDPFGGAESVFESVDVGSVDPDGVWDSLGEDDSPTPPSDRKRYADVSKHRYCEQCEHFAEPPAVQCTHEGTEILEFVDMETVRLLNCPVVAEQRELGNEE
ncbi:hypothetical protein NDI85_10465 [Halomicroarcula sp. S1AR25-4]|uniref:hypothetical protein n=1 Tax=Haloarcula sp. S1AR25-4 TaxID=2950538 RepID=UPI0028755E02|nr:hypothetical protein [Halomicroarcula sp. S1AR25-4]MDS0278219.1 hypothetical protein [Halomicroarcula sp. S1AR25-4]